MKTLNQLDSTEFLKRCWLIADAVQELLTESQVMELRKVQPTLTGKETDEEVEQKKTEQGKKNVLAIAKALLYDNAEGTAKLLPLLYELDDGEEITPFKQLKAITATIGDKDVIDFLTSLLKLGQMDIGA